MARYKNVILLALMLVMAIFIASAVSSIANGLADLDNAEVAAENSGITVQIMEVDQKENHIRFIVNMVNSSQYKVDCLNGEFVLQQQDSNGKWKTMEDAVLSQTQEEFDLVYDLPSGQNRSYWVSLVGKSGEAVTLTDGQYRICKDIHRDMSQDSRFEDLTLKVEFSWPQILSESRAFNKPVDTEEVAAKLARTLLPEQTGMVDYWNPTVEKISSDDLYQVMEHNPFEAEGLGKEESYWQVSFPVGEADDADSLKESFREQWVMFVSPTDGTVYGPVLHHFY